MELSTVLIAAGFAMLLMAISFGIQAIAEVLREILDKM